MRVSLWGALPLVLSLLVPVTGDAAPRAKPAKAADSAQIDQVVQRANQAYKAGRHLEAARGYAEALALAQNPGYFTNLIKELRYADEAEAALDLLQVTLARYPAERHPEFVERAEAQERVLPELRARALEQQGDRLADKPAEAAVVYHLANQLRPRPRTRKKEAEAQRKAGRLPDALRAYEQTLRDAEGQPLPPEQRDEVERAVLQLRHQIARERGEQLQAATPARAARAFEEAYQYQADADLLVRAAAGYRAAGELAAAQRVLERQQIDAKGEALQRVRLELAELRALQNAEQAQRLSLAGESAGAIGILRTTLKEQPVPALRLQLARIYQIQGASAEALDSHQAYLRSAPAALPRAESEAATRTLTELLRTREALRQAGSAPFYRKPWFTVVCTVSALAIGAGVTAAVLLTRTPAEPATDLGTQPVVLP